MAALTPELRATVSAHAAVYGYTLDQNDCLVSPTGRESRIKVTHQKGRFFADSSAVILWSGPNIGNFLTHFWYAKKVAA